jgi:hypothetical protein
MASSAATYAAAIPVTKRATRVPWTIWAGIIAITSSLIGGTWDVSWHRSIGRDSFLTPAHLLIYACGVIAAIVCGYLILYTTFGRSQRLKSESVSVLGFRAPLGAFIAAWGGIAMLVSAPFDNWWHNAYGLDVKIISPPHTLLILGIRGVSVGILFLVLAAMNRLRAAERTRTLNSDETSTLHTLQKIFLYIGGGTLIGQMFFIQEQTWDIVLHTTEPYIALGIAVPIAFAAFSRASGNRWACTICAAIYTAFVILEIQILPLIPATPKLGPVFNQVTHLIPGKFPILIIVPAIALDLLWHRLRAWKPWQIALLSGVVFTAIIFAVEWPFANFLMSKASENRFFGTIYFDYNSRPDMWDRLRQFVEPVSGLPLAIGMAWATLCAVISTWIGLFFGNWMRGVQR